MMSSMKTHAVRIPEHLYEELREKAAAERRSLTRQLEHELTLALAAKLTVELTPPEPWPGEVTSGSPTLDPGSREEQPDVEPWPEPEPPTTFVRADEVAPDWK
jgi:hypothetical protein